MFLGGNFAMFINNDKRKGRILSIHKEMEQIQEKLSIFKGKMTDSIHFNLKKLAEFIQEGENLKHLKEIKASFKILQENYERVFFY